MLLLPVLLLLGSVRLLITNEYLAFEYGKASFPVDPFGFELSQRLEFASANFRYVRENQPIDALANQRLGDQPLYNARELKHMQDVQKVYQTAMRIWHLALGLFLLASMLLVWQEETRQALLVALKAGGLLTVGLIAFVGLLAAIAWQAWFVVFHQVFFASGTWKFNTFDTLIRLFPEKFWFDAVGTISGLSLAVAPQANTRNCHYPDASWLGVAGRANRPGWPDPLPARSARPPAAGGALHAGRAPAHGIGGAGRGVHQAGPGQHQPDLVHVFDPADPGLENRRLDWARSLASARGRDPLAAREILWRSSYNGQPASP